MPCPYCDDSHSAFDPCPQSIAAVLKKEKKPKAKKAKPKRGKRGDIDSEGKDG